MPFSSMLKYVESHVKSLPGLKASPHATVCLTIYLSHKEDGTGGLENCTTFKTERELNTESEN